MELCINSNHIRNITEMNSGIKKNNQCPLLILMSEDVRFFSSCTSMKSKGVSQGSYKHLGRNKIHI